MTRNSLSHANRPLFTLFALLMWCAGLLSGCPRSGVQLVIVAASDLTPYEEVDRIEVELVGVGLMEGTNVERGDDLAAGIEVYHRRHATLDGRHVRITFLRAGVEVMTRDMVFDHQADREISVLMPRECEESACDGDETCVRGVCAPSTCVDGTEAECPEATCTADTECVAEAACAAGTCRDGTCLVLGDDEVCDALDWCDPTEGCAPRRTTVTDAGIPDAGVTDAGPLDAGFDGAVDDAPIDDAAVDDAAVDDAAVDDAAVDDAAVDDAAVDDAASAEDAGTG